MKPVLFWVGAICGTILFALLTFMSFSEWWIVKIKKDTNDYFWGPINENPWYYDNAELYSTVMLTEGLLMLPGLLFTIWFLARREKSRAFYSLVVCLSLAVLITVNGQIQ